MKKVIGFAFILALAGCTTASYQAGLATLTSNVVATNQAIADISSSLAKNCNTIEATARSIADLTSTFTSNTTANGSLSAANAVLSTWCQSPPSDIASAVQVTAAEVVAAKAAYQNVKNGG